MEASPVDNSAASNTEPEANTTNPPTENTQVATTVEGEGASVEPEVEERNKKAPTEEEPVLEEGEEENNGDDEEDYNIEEEEDEEEDWTSSEESPRPARHSKRNDAHDSDDEDYGHSKRRKVEIVKKPVRRDVTANESTGMKALRAYTTALKLGPRCFRNLNKIDDLKEREVELINRLHNLGRTWAGEYPSDEEIVLAREETLMKKEEKAREFIIDVQPGVRSTRKAAQKAMEFVKSLEQEEVREEEEEVEEEEEEEEIEDEDDENDEE